MKIEISSKWFDSNQIEELIQKCAWRLVRSAEDRITGVKCGTERLIWCINKLKGEFPEMKPDAEDFIRSAFVNFKLESK